MVKSRLLYQLSYLSIRFAAGFGFARVVSLHVKTCAASGFVDSVAVWDLHDRAEKAPRSKRITNWVWCR